MSGCFDVATTGGGLKSGLSSSNVEWCRTVKFDIGFDLTELKETVGLWWTYALSAFLVAV